MPLAVRPATATKAALTAAVAVALVGIPCGAAWSAAPESAPVTWSVSPADANGPDGRAIVDLTLDPGATMTEHLSVRNFSEQETTFSLTAADGYYTTTGRFNMLAAGEQSTDAGTWIAVEPSVTIAAGGSAVVPYTISVPGNATPGDHAAGIAASVLTSATDADGTQIGVDSRVGFRISARVTGELAPAIGIAEVSADYSPSWSLFSPGRVTVSYTVTNTGNTSLAVSDALGGATAEHGNLLPGEERTITRESIEAWPLGLLFLDLVVEGRAPADSPPAPAFRQTLTVWAIPWLHLLAALGVALIILAIFTGRRRNKRRLERLIEEAREDGRRSAKESVPTP